MESEILLLQEVREDGKAEVGRISRDKAVELGRSPSDDSGITIANQAVSSVHAKIFNIGGYWAFEDLGSTNGSWLNGEISPPGVIRIIRSNDVLQLANVMIEVVELSAAGHVLATKSQTAPKRAILALHNGNFVREFLIPEYGKALVVGGPEGDLEIEGAVSNAAAIIIERKGVFTTLTTKTKDLSVLISGVPINSPANLRDGDIVSFAHYQLLVIDPPQPTNNAVTSTLSLAEWGKGPTKGPGESRVGADSDLLDKPAQSTVFGRPKDSEQEEDPPAVVDPRNDITATQRFTAPIMPQKMGRDYHPSMRNVGVKEEFSFEAFEERVVWIIGFALFIAFLILLAVWLFAKNPVT